MLLIQVFKLLLNNFPLFNSLRYQKLVCYRFDIMHYAIAFYQHGTACTMLQDFSSPNYVQQLTTFHLIPVELPARGAPVLDKKFFQGPSKGWYIPSAVSEFWFLGSSGTWILEILASVRWCLRKKHSVPLYC